MQYILACATGDLVLYGVADQKLDRVRLVRAGQPAVAADLYAPPSGRDGTAFLIVTRAGRAGRVDALAGGRVAWRRALGARSELCSGGEPSDDAVGTL